MILELHHVTIGQQVEPCSFTVADGQLLSITGGERTGKSTILRAILGFLPIDGGYISIDGELLTPESAAYFRRMTAYVPQHLLLPEGYDKVQNDYLWLLGKAVASGKPLLIVDEPSQPLSPEQMQEVGRLLRQATGHGAAVVAVHALNPDIEVRL